MEYIQAHWADLVTIYTSIVTVASLIVKLTPTLPKDHWALPVIRWLSVWVAINTKTPTKRPN